MTEQGAQTSSAQAELLEAGKWVVPRSRLELLTARFSVVSSTN